MTKYKNYKNEKEFIAHQGGDRHALIGLALEARDLLEFCDSLPYRVNTKDYNSVVEEFYNNWHWPPSACQDMPEMFKFLELPYTVRDKAARAFRIFLCLTGAIKHEELSVALAHVVCELRNEEWRYTKKGVLLGDHKDWIAIREGLVKDLARKWGISDEELISVNKC